MRTAQELVAEAKQRIKEVSVQELANTQDTNALIIDIREPAEYNAGHNPQAINLPRGVLEFQLVTHPQIAGDNSDPHAVLQQLKNRPVYLICRSGGRSALSADSLQQMGLEQVYSVAGGMQAWQNEGLPTEV